jgi:hypothetical protein
MRIKAALALLFLMALGAPAFGQSFVGKWTATANSPGGSSSETLTIVKVANGFVITGKPVAPAPEGMAAGPGLDVALDGNRFSYKRTLTIPGGIIVITYSGVVSGDTFSGTAQIGGATVAYTGVRIKDKR